MKELTNEMQNLLELLISEDDANFELGKILLTNYKEQFRAYLKPKKISFGRLVRIYHFYNQWFANIEFEEMNFEVLHYLLKLFQKLKKDKIRPFYFMELIIPYFSFVFVMQLSKEWELKSFYNGQLCATLTGTTYLGYYIKLFDKKLS